MSERPLVSIVIVSWNVRDQLRACLRSLETFLHFPYEVIVIDNASPDGSGEMVKKEFPLVVCIANSVNNGFAAANNQARMHVHAPYVLFLNPDTELTNDAVTPLLAWAAAQSALGAVGPELLNPNKTHQQSVRNFPTLSDQLLVLLKLSHFTKWLPVMKRDYADPGAGQRQPLSVDQIMGAALLIPSPILDEVGWFDDGYPNWFEEVDLCQRLRRMKKDVWYAPVSQIIHHGGSSFGQVLTTKKHRWFLVGLRRYAHRFWPWWQAAIIDVVAVFSYGLTIIQLAVKPR